ncbi:hypothetical protein DQG23_24285 [Paenibacillus contaminans]|uniref:Helix-turn-helix domain-containing protein n=1 Tax=Paenibacillus contaminans TaxID=450362 RepID=A0A329MGB6_9BACL|nr:hypothetical protein DQG23_24285 [Paenibacillus contaminans]
MLPDTERKVITILFNLYGQTWAAPNLAQISRYAQRRQGHVKAAVKRLQDEGYIEVAEGKLRVIRLWEQQPKKVPRWQPIDF